MEPPSKSGWARVLCVLSELLRFHRDPLAPQMPPWFASSHQQLRGNLLVQPQFWPPHTWTTMDEGKAVAEKARCPWGTLKMHLLVGLADIVAKYLLSAALPWRYFPTLMVLWFTAQVGTSGSAHCVFTWCHSFQVSCDKNQTISRFNYRDIRPVNTYL